MPMSPLESVKVVVMTRSYSWSVGNQQIIPIADADWPIEVGEGGDDDDEWLYSCGVRN